MIVSAGFLTRGSTSMSHPIFKAEPCGPILDITRSFAPLPGFVTDWGGGLYLTRARTRDAATDGVILGML